MTAGYIPSLMVNDNVDVYIQNKEFGENPKQVMSHQREENYKDISFRFYREEEYHTVNSGREFDIILHVR